MSNKKGRENAIHLLLRQQNLRLEDLARDHAHAKNKLENARQSYSDLTKEVGEIESEIRESAKQGEAISLNIMQWQRQQLNQQRDFLNEKKIEKDQATDECEKKHKELVGQKQKIETFERLAEKYKDERNKIELNKNSQELDALSAQSSAQKNVHKR